MMAFVRYIFPLFFTTFSFFVLVISFSLISFSFHPICSPPSLVKGEKEMLQSLATSSIAAAVAFVCIQHIKR